MLLVGKGENVKLPKRSKKQEETTETARTDEGDRVSDAYVSWGNIYIYIYIYIYIHKHLPEVKEHQVLLLTVLLLAFHGSDSCTPVFLFLVENAKRKANVNSLN